MLAYADTGDAIMIRHLALATLAAVALGGCATDYAYRGGAGGDYYYGQPSVQYYDYGYGAPYGSLYGYPGGWSFGLGYGYGGYGYGYPYYGGGYYPYPYWPYYWHRPHHHHRPPREPTGPITGGRMPPNLVRNGTPYGQLPEALPREGGQPMLPPRRGYGDIEPPRMSRPAPPMVRDPAAHRGESMSERRPPPPMVRQAPPAIRQAPPPMSRPAPRMESSPRSTDSEK